VNVPGRLAATTGQSPPAFRLRAPIHAGYSAQQRFGDFQPDKGIAVTLLLQWDKFHNFWKITAAKGCNGIN
jgi:hypothetical protein